MPLSFNTFNETSTAAKGSFSPRSLTAIQAEGLNPDDLLVKPLSSFMDPTDGKWGRKFAEKRLEYYNRKRRQNINDCHRTYHHELDNLLAGSATARVVSGKSSKKKFNLDLGDVSSPFFNEAYLQLVQPKSVKRVASKSKLSKLKSKDKKKIRSAIAGVYGLKQEAKKVKMIKMKSQRELSQMLELEIDRAHVLQTARSRMAKLKVKEVELEKKKKALKKKHEEEMAIRAKKKAKEREDAEKLRILDTDRRILESLEQEKKRTIAAEQRTKALQEKKEGKANLLRMRKQERVKQTQAEKDRIEALHRKREESEKQRAVAAKKDKQKMMKAIKEKRAEHMTRLEANKKRHAELLREKQDEFARREREIEMKLKSWDTQRSQRKKITDAKIEKKRKEREQALKRVLEEENRKREARLVLDKAAAELRAEKEKKRLKQVREKRIQEAAKEESRRAAKAKAQGEAEELAWLSQIKLRDAAKRAQEIIDKRDELIREKKLEAEFATMAKHDRIARLRRQREFEQQQLMLKMEEEYEKAQLVKQRALDARKRRIINVQKKINKKMQIKQKLAAIKNDLNFELVRKARAGEIAWEDTHLPADIVEVLAHEVDEGEEARARRKELATVDSMGKKTNRKPKYSKAKMNPSQVRAHIAFENMHERGMHKRYLKKHHPDEYAMEYGDQDVQELREMKESRMNVSLAAIERKLQILDVFAMKSNAKVLELLEKEQENEQLRYLAFLEAEEDGDADEKARLEQIFARERKQAVQVLNLLIDENEITVYSKIHSLGLHPDDLDMGHYLLKPKQLALPRFLESLQQEAAAEADGNTVTLGIFDGRSITTSQELHNKTVMMKGRPVVPSRQKEDDE